VPLDSLCELAIEPQLCKLPITPYGFLIHAEHLCYLGFFETAEKPHIHYTRLSFIECLELVERIIEQEYVAGGLFGGELDVFEGKAVRRSAAFFRLMGSGMIDEHLSHDPRGDTKKVNPVLRPGPIMAYEPQIRLMHESGRLKCVIRALLADVASRLAL
jgi:hypothetical protein